MLKNNLEKPISPKSKFKTPASLRLWNLGKAGLTVALAVLVIFTIVKAGSLTPTASIGTATGYTLSDIYNKILNITFVPSAHTVSTTTSPALSFKSLSDIYNKLDEASTTLIAAKIASTTTIFGVTGTLYGDTDPSKVLTTAHYAGTAYPSAPLKTGQTACYDINGSLLSSCAGTGEDGESHAGIDTSYHDNTNGTITDNSTGLMWQKCSVGQDPMTCSGNANSIDFATATSTCATLNLGDHPIGSWRLPNVREFTSIVDYSTSSPAINLTYFPFTQSDYYWSSSRYIASPGTSWTVTFLVGFVYSGSRGNIAFVRCVRSLP